MKTDEILVVLSRGSFEVSQAAFEKYGRAALEMLSAGMQIPSARLLMCRCASVSKSGTEMSTQERRDLWRYFHNVRWTQDSLTQTTYRLLVRMNNARHASKSKTES